ncbi:MAG: hypothetical protein ACTSO9_14760, partial [Candidatus Helarchaeota archaeon]
VVKNISGKMGSLVGVRVYISITDRDGNFIYADDAFDEYQDFIKKFVQTNFNYLHQGEHSIPLSSENIIFFKTTENTMTILYNPKGKIGQLLAFKSMMNTYYEPIESSIQDAGLAPASTIKEAALGATDAQAGLETLLLSHKKMFFSKIIPKLRRELKKKDKFNLTQSMILNKCDGTLSLNDIIKNVGVSEKEVIETLYKFLGKKLVEFNGYQLLNIHCPECKNSAFLFIPDFLLQKSKKGLRVQLFPEGCNHTFVVFIDPKLKIKTKTIEKLVDKDDTLDLSNLSIQKLVAFFGQDIFFNIFHAIFFRFYTVFIGEEKIVNEITEFLRKIFTQLEYGRHIFSIDQSEFEKNTRKYNEFLVIDFDSKITIDPYEEDELFDFEFKLFKKVLKNEDENLQILDTYSEFERLILLTDTILKELETIKQISEDDLIKILDEKYQMKIKRYEIPIIKKLSEIYYNTDINKKVTRTVVGQMSNWFEKI